MSRTRRKSFPRTGKQIGNGELPEEFRIKQERGHVKNSFFDNDYKEEVWEPGLKKFLKRKKSKKERKNSKEKLRSY